MKENNLILIGSFLWWKWNTECYLMGTLLLCMQIISSPSGNLYSYFPCTSHFLWWKHHLSPVTMSLKLSMLVPQPLWTFRFLVIPIRQISMLAISLLYFVSDYFRALPNFEEQLCYSATNSIKSDSSEMPEKIKNHMVLSLRGRANVT